MSLNSTVSNILTNKMVLNVVFVIAVLNVIGYMVIGHLNAVLFFIILVILVGCYSSLSDHPRMTPEHACPSEWPCNCFT